MSNNPSARPVVPPQRPAAPAASGSGLGFVPIDPVLLLRRWWPVLAVAFVVGAVLGVTANEVLKRVYPLYKTQVFYQILPQSQDPTKGVALGEDKDEMERFLLTQSRVMSSDRILRSALTSSARVFEEDTSWGRGNVVDSSGKVDVSRGLGKLRDIATAGVVAGTNLVQMSVTTNRADDSAAIARAIHDSYWTDWRNLSRRSRTETALPINESLSRLRTELTRLDTARDRLILERNINELREQKSMSEDIEIQALQPQIAQNAEQIRRLQSTIRQYETLAAGAGGVVTIPDEIRDLVERDAVVVELKQRLSSLRSEIMANVQLGDDHPTVRQARRRVEATEAELASLRESQMRKIFDAELDRSRRGLEGSQSVQTELMGRLTQAVSRKQDVTRALAEYDKIMEDRKRVQDEIERNQAALTAIDLTQDIRGTEGDRVDRIRVLVPPAAPDEMHFPKLTVMLPLGVVLVFGLTAGLILLRELLDQRIKGPSDVLSVPRVRLMGVIPSVEADPTRPAPETAYRDAPMGALADAYRQVRSPLVKRMQQSGYKSLLVAGGQPGSGSTSAACNLALGCALADQRVLLIDANLRRPALHRIFKVGEGPGLGEVLARKNSLEQAIQQTGTANLHVLTAGAAASRGVPERLSTELMSQTIAEAASKYDMVIIDASPAAITGDAMALANRVDATLLVIRARSEKRGLIARLRDQFESARGEFLGVVVQGVEVTRTGYLAKNIKASQEYAGNIS